MIQHLKQLVSHREMLWAWTGRTIRGRYQQSVLGWFWAIVQPAALVAVYTVIFTRFVRVDTGETPYIVFSYVALVPWTLFSTSLVDMSNSLVQNMNLVTKIYFPREVLPVASMLARLLDFGVAAVLLVILIVVYQVPLFPVGWLFLPLILAIQLALMLGLGLASAALNVFSRDVQPLLTLVIQLWFYASPIIYPVSLVPDRLRPFYFLNPMAGVIEAYRAVLLHGEPPGSYLLSSALITLLALLLGYWLFKRVEPLFADIV